MEALFKTDIYLYYRDKHRLLFSEKQTKEFKSVSDVMSFAKEHKDISNLEEFQIIPIGKGKKEFAPLITWNGRAWGGVYAYEMILSLKQQ